MKHQRSSIPPQASRQALPGGIRVNGGASPLAVSAHAERQSADVASLAQRFGEAEGNGGIIEVINSAELGRRLGVPESWVRSRSNPKRTDDPIPHYKFGRYVQFPWGSDVLRAWLDRQLVSTDRAGHSRRNG